jgi:prolipoprotein diacylglyceryltransferase
VPLRTLCTNFLDTLVCPDVYILRRSWSAFKVCGYIGLTLAIFLGMALTMSRGLSLWVLAGLGLVAVFTFLSLAMATKILTGAEQLIYYHHEIAIMAVAALLLRLMGHPVLPYLDITILGIGMFLICGRIGCFLVGCCHGRPHRWGVCYRHAHATAGFPAYYVGVRLFPIQIIESLSVLCIVLVGTILVLCGHPPGEALAWYVMSYGVARFGFEFARGDVGRPDLWGFSEAQWTSLLLMGAGVGADMAGIVTLHPWHSAVTAGLAMTMLVVVCQQHRQCTATHRLLHPSHVKEVAEAVAVASHRAIHTSPLAIQLVTPTEVHVGCTSLGLQISASNITAAVGALRHYALSSRQDLMTHETATALARLILQLTHITASYELRQGSQGVFHVFVPALYRL